MQIPFVSQMSSECLALVIIKDHRSFLQLLNVYKSFRFVNTFVIFLGKAIHMQWFIIDLKAYSDTHNRLTVQLFCASVCLEHLLVQYLRACTFSLLFARRLVHKLQLSFRHAFCLIFLYVSGILSA